MNKDFTINVSRSEALRRYVLGTGLLAAVLISPAVPAWIALFACYPIFTGMLQWDPLNALMQKVVSKSSKDMQDVMFRESTAA